eukprot:comp23494_c2_seq1/m.39334 comp23494_c2_seq1/g.39334  ORF comp23494_c2_seq1/g.39334 comp23494_c2_seq1/m.39334 type:complete len:510 (-) comp23494_c2_seq1:258-1787(-)
MKPQGESSSGRQQAVKTMVFRSLKRTHDMFLSEYGKPVPEFEESARLKLQCKIHDEYQLVKDMEVPVPVTKATQQNTPAPEPEASKAPSQIADAEVAGGNRYPVGPGVQLTAGTSTQSKAPDESSVSKIIDSLDPAQKPQSGAVSLYQGGQNKQQISLAGGQGAKAGGPGTQLAVRQAPKIPKPQWHAPWKLYRVISGHSGWVRCVAFDPHNQWFATGSNDRTIKIWDLASGTLKLSLTGHVSHVRALAVSDRHPYMFSAGEDKQIKCWDLEVNKVIRHYHGHLSAIYDLALHPTLDVLVTASRDSTARVWDMRTKACVHVLAGHQGAVSCVRTQAANPQILTGSMDSTVRLWDLAAGKSICTLTNHKKSVRAAVIHPSEFSFASAAADHVKKWKFPDGEFVMNFDDPNVVVNSMAVNQDSVAVTAADNGMLHFYDWKTGYNFQKWKAPPQPGSLESEAGIYAVGFDMSGSRLVTCEADKSIKMYKEDDTATEESHPVQWKPDIRRKRF